MNDTDGFEPEERLGATAARGVIWQGLAFLTGRGLVLAATVLLARLLVPEEFGLVALALVFIAYIEVVSDLGVAQAVVYLPADRRTNDAAFLFALASSGFLALLAVLAAPLVADFFGQPDVAPLFRVLSISLVLGAVAQVPDALLRKDLLFRRRMGATLTRSIGRGVASVGLAALGAGPWSIAWGYVLGDLAYAVVAWSLVSHRPRLDWEAMRWVTLGPLVTYGGSAAFGVLLSKLIFDIDYLIIGRRLGAEALAYYTLAFRLPEMAIISMFFVFSSVAFPVYSRVKDDPERLRRGYLMGLRLQATYGMTAGVATAVVAPALVPVLFGQEWSDSVVPLQGLALYAAFRSLGVGATDVYKATGRPGLVVRLAAVRFLILVPALVLASTGGINAIAMTQAGVSLLFAMVMQIVAGRVIGTTPAQVAGAVGPALLCSASVALAALGAGAAGPDDDLVRLVLQAAAGAVAGALTLRLAAPALLADTRELLSSRARPVPA